MLRFLKKRFKSSKNPVPPGNPTHQNTDVGAERGRDSEGGYRSGGLELMWPMGLIRPSHQISTTEGFLGSRIMTARVRINSSLRGVPPLQLPGKRVAMRVSVAGCNCLGRRLLPFPISLQGRGQAHDDSTEAQREHEGRGPIIQQPSEIVPEHTIGDGQDGGGAHDIDQTQSGKSRGKSWCFCHTTVRIDH